MTATELLWSAVGRPDAPGTEIRPAGRCCLCGGTEASTGLPARKAIRATFTNYDLLRGQGGTHVCSACLTAQSEKWPMPGREKLQKLRNYSHMVTPTSWETYSKTRKDRRRFVAALLADHPDPWGGVVAVSGQKHLLFRAPVNPPGVGRLRFLVEEEECACSREDLRAVLELVATLGGTFSVRTSSHGPGEVETGQYRPDRIATFGPAEWAGLEEQLEPWRGTVLFSAALFLATPEKTDERNGRRARPVSAGPADADSGSDTPPASRPSRGRGQSPDALGPSVGGGPDRGEPSDGIAGLVRPGDATPSDRKSGQIALFGD